MGRPASTSSVRALTIRSSQVRLRPAVWSVEAVAVRLAALIAAAWVALVAATFGRVVEAIYWNADAASAMTIGQLFPSVPDGATVTLANFPWYEFLWFELLTRHLPFHRQIWEVAPWAGSLASIWLLWWATATVAGRWAGRVVAFVCLCAGSALLLTQMAADFHATAVWHACILDAYLVLVVARGGTVGSRGAHVALAAAMAVLAAIGTASDMLLYLSGLVPFTVAGLLVARLAPRPAAARIAWTTLGVAAGAVAGSRAVVAAMEARHVVAGHMTITFAPWNELVQNSLDALQSLATLFNGRFDGQPIDARSLLTFACGAVVFVALVAAIRHGVRWARSLAAPVRAGARAGDPAELLRTAHLAFWLLAAALPVAGFVLSNLAGSGAGRYLVTTAYGLAVVTALAASSRGAARRAVVTLGACVIALAGVVSVATDLDPSDGRQMERDILPFVEGEGLTVGYSAYWVGVPLTWASHMKVQIYPLVSCPKGPHGICTYLNHTISSWYRPRRGIRSFLIVDHRYGPPDPGTSLGGTVEIVNFKHYSVYVYDYDIASNIGDWRRYTTPS